jgi:3-(3-hydroxy-phenyl)propionate hydroxylase
MGETKDHEVVIAGGGPTGMMLAGELRLAGVDVAIVEPRLNHDLESGRSRGLHARTIEVLDQRGIADRFLAEGYTAQVQIYAGTVLDISDFPTRHNYGLALLQKHFERILGGWVDELGVPMYRAREVTGCTSGCPTVARCGRRTLSDATAGAASSARPPASASRGGTPRRAG